ncbi:MAG TPA: protein kinase, partial [Vicinamibacterales bacterium]
MTRLATSTPNTAHGTILGTVHYMAPEQVEGKEADARSDIWALGAVIYEMATGKRPFDGASPASVIGAILKDDPPPMLTLQPLAPPALGHIVQRCLTKDRDDRWQSMRDVAKELDWIAHGEVSSASPVVAPGRARSNSRLIALTIFVCLAFVSLLPLAIRHLRESPPDRAPIQFLVSPPSRSVFNSVGRDAGPVVVSPDGSRLAFVATNADGQKRIHIRPLGALSADSLAGTEGASYPFWSPDSRFLGFFAEGKLKKIDASGGPPQTLCDAPLGRGGAWNRNGLILFSPGAYDPLFRISAAGGAVSQVTRIDQASQELSHRWPQFLPDGVHFLFLAWSTQMTGSDAAHSVYVGSLDSDESRLILRSGSRVAYAEPEHLLFMREGVLLAAGFDAKRLSIVGDPIPLAEQVQHYVNTGSAVFSASDTGVLAYQAGATQAVSRLMWFGRDGRAVGTVPLSVESEDPQLSPRGDVVAVNTQDPKTGVSNIWLYDFSKSAGTRFTFAPSFDRYPSWSPDGSRIVFDSNRRGPADIYWKALGSTGSEELLLHSNQPKQPTDWSADGRLIAFQQLDPTTKWDLWVLPVAADRKPMPFLQTSSNEMGGQLSPNGRWMAYSSDESGRWEVYVAAFPGPGGKWQVSSGGGGAQPRWRRDGKELFDLSLDRKLMAVAIAAGIDFEASEAKVLFETRARYTGDIAYDAAPDGQRFLINTVVAEETGSPITVVVNWAEP